MRPPACNCPQHESGAPTELYGHGYHWESDPDHPSGAPAYRWACSCGRRGKWQHQGDRVAYHGWRAHVDRTNRRRNLRQTEEMYR